MGKTRETDSFPLCDSDCFASKDGRCVALSDNDFGYSCPFYKPESEEVNTAVIEAAVKAYKPMRKEADAWALAL